MTTPEPGRVLSIQSHVVSGYVGNRAATFPLQMLGYDVDVINTVQFSNHTGYGHTNGHKTTPSELTSIFEGLRTNGLLSHSRILTGYIPGAEALKIVAGEIGRVIEDGKEEVLYVLDPVMGDIGTGLYVSQDVVPVYKEMLKLATIITPNQFEVELLSGIQITSLQTLHSALLQLHIQNSLPYIAFSSIPLPIALVTSLNLPPPPESYTSLLPDTNPPWYDAVGLGEPEDEVLVCFASTLLPSSDNDEAAGSSGKEIETWAFALPTIRGYFSGVGDLFSAMVLAHFQTPSPSSTIPSLPYAVSKALLAVQQILLQTHLHSIVQSTQSTDPVSRVATPRPLHRPSGSKASRTEDYLAVLPSDAELDEEKPEKVGDPKRKAKRMRIRELRVVQERRLIVDGGEGWPGKKLDWDSILQQ